LIIVRIEAVLHGGIDKHQTSGRVLEQTTLLKPLLTSKGKNQSKILLIDNERVITDSLSVAEMSNEYFCKVARSDGDCMEMVEFVDHPSVKVIAKKTLGNCFNLVPVDVCKIRKILDTLHPAIKYLRGCYVYLHPLLQNQLPV